MFNTIFFHPFTWDNDMYLVYVAWVLIIFALFWFVRFIHKRVRRTKMKYQNGLYYLCRDIFMCLNGFEYLLFVCILFSIYMGYWAYVVKPSSADWTDWQTYMIILPQLCFLVSMVTLFFVRYCKFRKPYIK